MAEKEKEFKFTLTENESNLIVQALGELPFKIVGTLIANLQTQAAPQIAAYNAAAAEDKPAPPAPPAPPAEREAV